MEPCGVLSGADGVLSDGDWKRHEALADTLAMEMVDLPLSEAQANIEKEFAHDSPGLSPSIQRRH